ncbi:MULTISPECIES: FRG domain-containing protein [Bacillus cereus group]|uniref:FRG domain-containing protein n=1 Tax=Bacillus cereus group TaxID=86661 RepID=UPI0009B70DE0|nr:MULTISPECIES: FRG domain-containing protein [Bacillus cereus group]ARC28124.1 FRG domain-containing protein [Bacillus sp. FDAARGOS_235]PEI58907.1 FRG domain-containing protein [Bacillus toyonensis]PEP10905.1 FRG domain-containing protein [Bacillus toyonensis]
MKNFKNELFETIIEPTNFNELIIVLNNEFKPNSGNVKLWRGQGDINWPIHSGAYRRLINSGQRNIKELDILHYEQSLIQQATHKGFRYENGRVLSEVELLAKLQHHGAATRLVDFSKNALIALWFCVNSQCDKTGLLLAIHTDCIGGMESDIAEVTMSYSDFTQDLSDYNHPILMDPPVVSPRISAQHGVFLYSDVSSEKTGSLKIPTKEHERQFIAITPTLKNEARQILIDTFNIRTETIFPDFDGFSAANSAEIPEREMWRW